MPNLPLVYVSVYQRISEHFIRNSYVSLIRNGVTGPQNYKGQITGVEFLFCVAFRAQHEEEGRGFRGRRFARHPEQRRGGGRPVQGGTHPLKNIQVASEGRW